MIALTETKPAEATRAGTSRERWQPPAMRRCSGSRNALSAINASESSSISASGSKKFIASRPESTAEKNVVPASTANGPASTVGAVVRSTPEPPTLRPAPASTETGPASTAVLVVTTGCGYLMRRRRVTVRETALAAYEPQLRAIAQSGYTGKTQSRVAAFLTSESATELVQQMTTLDMIAQHTAHMAARAAKHPRKRCGDFFGRFR